MRKPPFQRFRERWTYILYGFLGKMLLNLIGYTCRFEVKGIEQFMETASKNKCILMLWHSKLMMIAEILYRFAPHFKYAALISDSRDGEVISVLANSYKHGRSIRIPHDAKPAALQNLIKEMKTCDDIIIITPDGPRGPAHIIKPGIVLAAKKTAAHVIPLTWTASRFWTIPTWDGLILPKPFSRISVLIGPPLFLPGGATMKTEEGVKILEEALLSLGKHPATRKAINSKVPS
jgi:lysophospholipid acyltransferase (LPLAT)-like uncharacterized protein